MKTDMFRQNFFSRDFDKILDAMPQVTETEKLNYEHNDAIEISLDVLIWIDKQFHII